MPNVGPMELAIVLIIALMVFGPKKLPELGRSLGDGMREFKDSMTGKGEASSQARQLEAGANERGGERSDVSERIPAPPPESETTTRAG